MNTEKALQILIDAVEIVETENPVQADSEDTVVE